MTEPYIVMIWTSNQKWWILRSTKEQKFNLWRQLLRRLQRSWPLPRSWWLQSSRSTPSSTWSTSSTQSMSATTKRSSRSSWKHLGARPASPWIGTRARPWRRGRWTEDLTCWLDFRKQTCHQVPCLSLGVLTWMLPTSMWTFAHSTCSKLFILPGTWLSFFRN